MEIADIWYAGIAFLVVVGVLAIARPDWLMQISHAASRRMQVRHIALFDKAHFIDRKLYHSHRTVGTLLMVLSALTLYLVLFVIGDEPVLEKSIETGEIVGGLALEVTLVIAVLSGIVGLCFGVVVLLRPSVLKPLEVWGNRWLHFPEEVLNREYGHRLEGWVAGHTRLFGVLVLAAAAISWFLLFALD